MSTSGGDPTANLLASLKAHSSRGSPAPDPGFSFALPMSPPSPGQALKSPSVTPQAPHNMPRQNTPASQRPPNLLGLLKFGQPSPSPAINTSQPNVGSSHHTSRQDNVQATPTKPSSVNSTSPSVHARGISASDLVSNIMGNKPSPQANPERPTKTSLSHQDSLLKLLNKTARGSESPHPVNDFPSPSSLPQDINKASFGNNQGERQQSPMRFFGGKENAEPSLFEPNAIPEGSPVARSGSAAFVNPFDGHSGSTLDSLPKQSPSNGGAAKRVKSRSPAVRSTSSRRKLTPAGDDVLQSIESSGPESRQDGRTPVEALMGIGAPSRDAETVAQALNEVGTQVDRQVGNALAKAEGKERDAHIKEEKDEKADTARFNAIEEHVHDAAVGLKKEFEKAENKGVLEEMMPAAAADAVKDIIDEAAEDQGESKDGQLVRQIKVYQFPMRPFVAIDLMPKDPSDLVFHEGSAVPIARFKKEFDQSDRTLATATHDFIAYAVPKNSGGIRVIEQDSGKSSLLFGDSQDRIFNIAISTGPVVQSEGHGLHRVIATGVSGAVYWATIAEPGAELSQEDMKISSVIFPPTSAGAEPASGGQLKTRAKRSSRSPDFFAIGRGKAIQIVFPAHARNSDFFDSKNSTLDTERYFLDRNLKVSTGKAGKDFTFSEDDTTIVTLDKAGKLRIWDIRELTDSANGLASKLAPIEVKSPILTFATVQAAEKSWPTSVLFVDKLRPYTKGIALRYIIVGMKQNHTLQLWDLCLGKAVQELNFPHEKETDGICSVTYHASSGIIAVGHPARNSIFFIHLSAPKYNLPSMSQAKFSQRLASNDHTLPKAEATAIMSGMREYSLSDKGQLRSVELTPSTGETGRGNEEDENPGLFDLYVMHSKGLHCLTIKKEDLGWSQESRVQHPIDAETAGIIVVKDLKEFSSTATTSDPAHLSANDNEQSSVSVPKAVAKVSSNENAKPERSESVPRADQKKGKKGGAAETPSKSTPGPAAAQPSSSKSIQTPAASAPQAIPDTPKEASRPALTKHASREAPEPFLGSVEGRAKNAIANGDTVSVGISGEFLDKELKKIEQGVSNEFNKVIRRELDSLYKQIAEDKRVQDASGVAKQDAILRLVASTLSENVEKSLSRIIHKSIQDFVLPSLAELTSTAMTKHINAAITEQVKITIPPVIKHTVGDAIKSSLHSPDMLRAISEQVSKTVSAHIDREFSSAMTKTITPGFNNAASNAAQKIVGDMERRVGIQLEQGNAQRSSNSVKIDQLTTLVNGMSGMLHTMAEAQSQFQSKILELQQQQQQPHSLTPSESASHPSPEQEELRNITEMWNNGNQEAATVTWLQSAQQVALFDEFFVHLNPNYLRDMSPLIVLSVGASVSDAMTTNVHERLMWLDAVIKATDPKADETREVGGRILDILTQRLEGMYMDVAENDPTNSALRTIATLTKSTKHVRRLFPQ